MQMQLIPAKTYATPLGVERAIVRAGLESLRYVIVYNEAGRCYPIFVGSEAVEAGVVFKDFPVVL